MKKITELILELENEYNLLEWKIDGVFAWQSARGIIYEKMLGLVASKGYHYQTIRKSSPTNLIKVFRRLFFNITIQNPYLHFKKKEVLVFESGRYEYQDNEYIDIYTEYICTNILSENTTLERYSCFSVTNNQPNNKNKKLGPHIDFIIFLSKLMKYFVKHEFTLEENVAIGKVEDRIFNRFGIDIDINNILHNEIKRFKSEYVLYLLLFKIKRSKKVYLVSAVQKAPLISAAKKCNNIVIELQHGLLSRHGIIGNYPYTTEDSLEYFPDYFALWTKPRLQNAKLPISNKFIIEVENMHLMNSLLKTNSTLKKSNQILIISGPYTASELFKYVMSNINDMTNWIFVVKLHPVENIEYFNSIFDKNIMGLSNLIFIQNEKPIYDLFQQSKYVIGVNSTALFEAKYFGCDAYYLENSDYGLEKIILEANNIKPLNPNTKLSEVLISSK